MLEQVSEKAFTNTVLYSGTGDGTSTYVTQTSGKSCVIVLYWKTLCGTCQDAKRNARETLVYAYPCHQPYSTPNTIGPRGTSWRVATSGVHASKAFLERYSRHGGNYWTERYLARYICILSWARATTRGHGLAGAKDAAALRRPRHAEGEPGAERHRAGAQPQLSHRMHQLTKNRTWHVLGWV